MECVCIHLCSYTFENMNNKNLNRFNYDIFEAIATLGDGAVVVKEPG